MSNDKIVLLGVQICRYDGMMLRPPLRWDPSKEDKGYHSVEGNSDNITREFIWGTGHEEQAGVFLDDLINRKVERWYWAQTPVPEFDNAYGFFVPKEHVPDIERVKSEFPKVNIQDELYQRPVYLGFGPLEDLKKLQTVINKE